MRSKTSFSDTIIGRDFAGENGNCSESNTLLSDLGQYLWFSLSQDYISKQQLQLKTQITYIQDDVK